MGFNSGFKGLNNDGTKPAEIALKEDKNTRKLMYLESTSNVLYQVKANFFTI